MEAAQSMGWKAFGVDVSREAITYCRDRGLSCDRYDGFELPFPSGFFDVITAWHVIEHVPSVRTALTEWYRVLRPGGVLAVETPAADCWKARLLGPRYRKFWPAEHTYTFTRRTLEPFLFDAGFDLAATPVLGFGDRHHPALMIYSILRRMYQGSTRITGFSKSFTIYCRKPKRRLAA